MTHCSTTCDAPMFISNPEQLHANYRRKKEKAMRITYGCVMFSFAIWLWVSLSVGSIPLSIILAAVFAVGSAICFLSAHAEAGALVNEADEISVSDLNDLIEIILENQHDQAIMVSINLINSQNRRPYIAEAKKIRAYVDSKNQRKGEIRSEQGVMEVFSFLANQKPS